MAEDCPRSAVPKEGEGDSLYKVGKSLAGMAPGGQILFEMLIQSPIQKRRDEFLADLLKDLQELEKKFSDFETEKLRNSDNFVTALMQALQIVLRSHQKEKLKALRNAVLNVALANTVDENLQMVMLSYIDSMTPLHILVLQFLHDPSRVANRITYKWPERMTTSKWMLLVAGYPETEKQREFIIQIERDLVARGLVDSDSLHHLTTKEGVLGSTATDIGNAFLKFISAP